MKIVVDMNLSPEWVAYLNSHGHDSLHWSNVGAVDASDSEIVDWARENEYAVFTSDLDFSTILASSGLSKPSIIQLRSEVTLPDRVGNLIVDAIGQAEQDLLRGAILSIDVGQARLRVRSLGAVREE